MTVAERFEDLCVEATLAVTRKVVGILIALFAVFAVANFVRLPWPAAGYLAAHDVVLVVLFITIKLGEDHWLRRRRANGPLAVFVPLAVLSNTMVSAMVGATVMPSLYVVLVIAATGAITLYRPWAIASMGTCIVAWLPVASVISTTNAELGEHVVVIVTAAGLGFVLNYAGREHTRRLAQALWDADDRGRRLELALAQAEQTRAQLDDKVGERTTELAAARDALASQLTDRTVAEERRLVLERGLADLQRSEAIGRLAGGIAHDFNNLLTVVSANVELILDGGHVGADDRESLKEVQDAVHRASRLIRQLMALGRKQVMQPRQVSLTDIIAGVRPMVTRVLGADIQLAIDFATNDGPIAVDVGQLEQVIMNLVLNARDAMPKGGILTIRAQTRSIDDPIAIGHANVAAGRYAVLEVADTGTGMDEATRRSAFEPFFTTKGPQGGSGLGLAAVHGIVSQHGGFVEVTSELGKGTTFALYLPAAATLKENTQPILRQPTKRGGHETLLVVEDEPVVLRRATEGLARLGYTVLGASSAAAALERLESVQGSIDVLLTDVIMPDVDGVKLAEQVRARWPNIRVMFMSGFAGDRLTARGLGPDDVLLEKPFTLRELADRIRTFLDAR